VLRDPGALRTMQVGRSWHGWTEEWTVDVDRTGQSGIDLDVDGVDRGLDAVAQALLERRRPVQELHGPALSRVVQRYPESRLSSVSGGVYRAA
jgi:hypothetical protein